MSETSDLQDQIAKRLAEALGDVDVRLTDTGWVFNPDSDTDVETYLALYGRMFGALVDIVATLAAEIDRLKSQDAPP